MQSVTRGIPSDPHQLLRGWMGAASGPEVLGWNPPFVTTHVSSEAAPVMRKRQAAGFLYVWMHRRGSGVSERRAGSPA
jgi:hypothetical protein